MEIVEIILVLIASFGAFYFTVKAIYHMYHIVLNVTGKNAGYLGPFILFMPSQFNEWGNKHRVALGPVLTGVIVSWLILFSTGVLNE